MAIDNNSNASEDKSSTTDEEIKNTGKGEDFEKLLEEVDRPSEKKRSSEAKEANIEDEDSGRNNESGGSGHEGCACEEDSGGGGFIFISMCIAIIALVLAIKVLLDQNNIASRTDGLQDRVSSVEENTERTSAVFEKKLEDFGNEITKYEVYGKQISELKKQISVTDKLQAAIDLKKTLVRLDDLSARFTGDSKAKADSIKNKIVELIFSLEHDFATEVPEKIKKQEIPMFTPTIEKSKPVDEKLPELKEKKTIEILPESLETQPEPEKKGERNKKDSSAAKKPDQEPAVQGLGEENSSLQERKDNVESLNLEGEDSIEVTKPVGMPEIVPAPVFDSGEPEPAAQHPGESPKTTQVEKKKAEMDSPFINKGNLDKLMPLENNKVLDEIMSDSQANEEKEDDQILDF